MDKRMRQRVALIVGLLFLIIAAEGILFYCMGTDLRTAEQQRLGALITEHPELEQQYIGIFQNKNSDGTEKSEEEAAGEIEAGESVEEKYGYSVENGMSRELIRRHFLWMAVILAAGALIMAVVVVVSLMERSRTKEELERMKERFEELTLHFEQVKQSLGKEENDTKSLVTDISHQLKTPIASLKMSCEIMNTTSLTPEERLEFQQKTYEEVNKLEILLNSLMNLSKLESKLIQINPTKGSIKETLIKAVSSTYVKASSKNIEIVTEEFEDVLIPHDLKWTAEVFVNILDNAIKYSPKGSKIKIRVSRLVSYILIEVEDEGIGISTKETHEIFKRFYRGKDAVIKNQEGSGVGLYLARRIVEQQGGTISVRPGRKSGSIFRVTLSFLTVLLLFL